MATSFFTLLDDIAILMDDVLVMSKIATKKTAGLLSDDLAVNAEKASGFVSDRELPILWEITKGSFLNKLIILPIAFLLSAFFPTAIILILLIGGLYLAYEGVEKIYHFLIPSHNSKTKENYINLSKEELKKYEKTKIRSAIVIDFILSVEIIIIALSTVLNQPLKIQIPVVIFVSILATVGVYGIVALIVRMDDFGYKLILMNNKKGLSNTIGLFLVNTLPIVIKALTIIGTIAMLLVAGGIYLHNIHYLENMLYPLPNILQELIIGFAIGLLALFLTNIFKSFFSQNIIDT